MIVMSAKAMPNMSGHTLSRGAQLRRKHEECETLPPSSAAQQGAGAARQVGTQRLSREFLARSCFETQLAGQVQCSPGMRRRKFGQTCAAIRQGDARQATVLIVASERLSA